MEKKVYDQLVEENNKLLSVINESKANQYDELLKENEELKRTVANQEAQIEQLYTKCFEAREAQIKAENKSNTVNRLRFILALPFAAIGYPFKLIMTGWFQLANWISGYNDFE